MTKTPGYTSSSSRPGSTSKPIAISARPRRSSTANALMRNSLKDRTPPKANGVDGFMFASPVRTRKLSQSVEKSISFNSPINDRATKWMFTREASIYTTTSTTMTSTETKEDRSPLFSPYHYQPVRHRYNLRSRVYQEDEKIDKRHVEIRHYASSHLSIHSQQSAKTHIEEQISKIGLDEDKKPIKDHIKVFIDYDEPLEICQLDISDLDTEEALESFEIVRQLERYAQNYPAVTNCLPPKDPCDSRITLVLDLDETLVHCSTDSTRLPDFDLEFDVEFQGQIFNVFVQKRPWVLEFFQAVSIDFEIVIFTASQQIYADKLLDLLDPCRSYTRHRLFRDSCIPTEGTFVKDLRVLGRDLSRIIIVDNAIEAFSYQINNGIPIKSWFSEKTDAELPKLANFLSKIARFEGDVRPILEEKFDLASRIVSGTLDDPFA